MALLIGILAMGAVVGSFDLARILRSGDLIRDSALYLPILTLLALGATTKSAQFPFHFWLPGVVPAAKPGYGIHSNLSWLLLTGKGRNFLKYMAFAIKNRKRRMLR